MRRRMTFGGVEKINEIIKDRDCVVYLGHYCNWEWVASLPLHLDIDKDLVVGQIYHRLESPAFDQLFLRMRSRFRAVNIEMFMALRQLVRYKQQKKRFIIGFISVYIDVQRVRRGYYHAEFILMTDQPKSFPNYEITVDYARRLEATIQRAPQFWLWSHNRWKRTYEEYLRRNQK